MDSSKRSPLRCVEPHQATIAAANKKGRSDLNRNGLVILPGVAAWGRLVMYYSVSGVALRCCAIRAF
ncbi:hypothetical protein P3T43_002329 [Paraburkholderia sp. GAS41]